MQHPHYNQGNDAAHPRVEEGTSYRQLVVLDHLDMIPAEYVFNLSVRHDSGYPIGDLGH